MHFSTIAASAAFVGSVLASGYDYVSTCTDETPAGYSKPTSSAPAPYYAKPSSSAPAGGYYAPSSSAPYVYKPSTTSAPVYYAPSSSAPYEVTYTSYTHITVTSCEAYVTNCPAKTYTSAVYSITTCTGETPYGTPSSVPYYSPPASVPYYSPPSNTTTCTETPYASPTPYGSPVPYGSPSPSAPATYTHTYYTTVCPAGGYCYGTTTTSTYCPTATPVVPPYTSAAPMPPTYTHPSNSSSTYAPPPSYTGAASSNAASFGVAAIAAIAALFIAA